jgi:hypothetical protein
MGPMIAANQFDAAQQQQHFRSRGASACSDNPSQVSQFVVIAELLRDAKAAEQRFLALWALDCLFDESRFIEKIAADLGSLDAPTSSGDGGWSMN